MTATCISRNTFGVVTGQSLPIARTAPVPHDVADRIEALGALPHARARERLGGRVRARPVRLHVGDDAERPHAWHVGGVGQLQVRDVVPGVVHPFAARAAATASSDSRNARSPSAC